MHATWYVVIKKKLVMKLAIKLYYKNQLNKYLQFNFIALNILYINVNNDIFNLECQKKVQVQKEPFILSYRNRLE